MKIINWFQALVLVTSIALTSAVFAVEADPETSKISETVTSQTQIDINSADADALAEMLDGVGISKAQEIVAHRETYGKFMSVDQLSDVRGIGEATLEKNRHKILVVTE